MERFEIGTLNWNANNNSQITISDGLVDGNMGITGNALVIISGGTIRDLWANSNSQITMSGGTTGSLQARDNSQITMSGGTAGGLYAESGGQIIMLDGTVGRLKASGGPEPSEDGQIIMSGGTVSGGITSRGKIIMSGGSSRYLRAYSSGQITLSGGSVESDFVLESNSLLIIAGSNFFIEGTPVGYGSITSILGGPANNEPYRRLTGT